MRFIVRVIALIAALLAIGAGLTSPALAVQQPTVAVTNTFDGNHVCTSTTLHLVGTGLTPGQIYSANIGRDFRLGRVDANGNVDETFTVTEKGQQTYRIETFNSRLRETFDGRGTIRVVKDCSGAPTLIISAAPHSSGDFYLTVSGSNLQPGTDVVNHHDASGTPASEVIGTVDSDGTFNRTLLYDCGQIGVYLTTTDRYGAPITSNTVAGEPGCA